MATIAAYCLKGHTVGYKQIPHTWGALQPFLEKEHSSNPQRWPSFCHECGSAVVEQCLFCEKRFPVGAKYCGGCGKALPWTEHSLEAARQYTDDLHHLTSDEKAKLQESLKDLTTDSAQTPLAASRVRQFVNKAGPLVGNALLEIAKTLATSEAKKHLGIG